MGKDPEPQSQPPADDLEAAAEPSKLTLAEVYRRVRALGLRTGSESVQMVREDRDAR